MQKKHLRVTKFSKHPLLTQAVDEEHWGLCDGHEEITHCQVHYEIIWQAPQLFITAHTHTHKNIKIKFNFTTVKTDRTVYEQ